jgi:hypothetical protein
MISKQWTEVTTEGLRMNVLCTKLFFGISSNNGILEG